MLLCPNNKETPLKDSLLEAFKNTPEDSVVKFVHMGLRQLRESANEARKEKGIETVEDYKP